MRAARRHRTKRYLLVATLQCALFTGCQTLPPQATPGPGSTAVDAAGVQHSATDYPKGQVPWLQDLLHTLGPQYPDQERALHHEGAGRFRVKLDLRSGTVVSVSVLQSTGFKALDECAVVALARWRWKPGRWKAVDIPVRYRIGSPSAGGTPLPNS